MPRRHAFPPPASNGREAVSRSASLPGGAPSFGDRPVREPRPRGTAVTPAASRYPRRRRNACLLHAWLLCGRRRKPSVPFNTLRNSRSGPRSPTSAQPAASATKTAAALLPLVSRLTPAGDMGLSVGNCRRLHPLQRRPDPSGNGPASRSPGTKNRKRVNV